MACRFDEFTPDIAENRYLKAAARLALTVPGVDPQDRRTLRRQVASLDDVADLVVLPDSLDRITFTRLNHYYRPALRLARLLLENLTLVDQFGDRSASSFLIDMNLLFERFVTQRLQRELRGRLDVLSQTTYYLAEDKQVMIRPDLVFRTPDRHLSYRHRTGRGSHDIDYVADIKYKLTSDASARISDYYQLLAYTTALDVPEGLLIYCLADGGKPEKSVTVRQVGKRLKTVALDLSGSTDAVDTAMRDAADWIVSRTRASVRPQQQQPVATRVPA